MKKRMYCVRDNKVSFWSPQEDQNDQSAIRNFGYLLTHNDMIMYAPQDYDLYFVGTFDSDSGVMEPVTPIQFIASGASVFGGLNNEKSER